MPIVIETHGPEGVEWGISFTSHNPVLEDYVPMKDVEAAHKLVALVNARLASDAASDPVAALHAGVDNDLEKCARLTNTHQFPSIQPLCDGRFYAGGDELYPGVIDDTFTAALRSLRKTMEAASNTDAGGDNRRG